MKPAWTYEVDGLLWRLVPSGSGKLVGEVRDISKKTTSFFCLNQLTGEVLWEGLTVLDRWWVGIEAVHGDTIFFHGFSTPEMPEHKGIVAVALRSGETLWQNQDMTFVSVEDYILHTSVKSLKGKMSYKVECLTGVIRESMMDDSDLSKLEGLHSSSTVEGGIEFPSTLESVETLKNHFNVDALVGDVEGVEHGNLLIFSVHERFGDTSGDRHRLRNTLKVLDQTTNDTLFTSVLNADTAGIVPESFFVQHDILYFVQGRNRLTAIHLRTPHAED